MNNKNRAHLLEHQTILKQTLQKQVAQSLVLTSHEKVFIVHGHDHAARDTVEDFVDNWGLTPTVLDEQPNKGRTIISVGLVCPYLL